MKQFSGLLKKIDGELKYIKSSDEAKYSIFKKSVPDDCLVEIYMEIQEDDGTLAQLAKIHSMIRTICKHTGDTFEDMKLIIKKRAGLCIEKELEGSKFLYCKSFGDCSRDELSLAIQAIQEVGFLLELPL